MKIEYETVEIQETYPRFGTGKNTGMLYIQLRPNERWVCLEEKTSNSNADMIKQLPKGTVIKITI